MGSAMSSGLKNEFYDDQFLPQPQLTTCFFT
jgi:hypothetical protein